MSDLLEWLMWVDWWGTWSWALWLTMVVGGFLLAAWATITLKMLNVDLNVEPVKHRTRNGPYRWMKHPMYFGTEMMVAGCAGIAAGAWNAFAAFTIVNLLQQDWRHREGP